MLTGWRRKLGCITLVMALISCSAWIRSLMFEDIVLIAHAKIKTVTILGSNNYGLVWAKLQLTSENISGPSVTTYGWTSAKNDRFSPIGMLTVWSFCKLAAEPASDPTDASSLELQQQSLVWERHALGFHLGEAREQSSFHSATWVIPYWSIVTPLTLVSMSLLVRVPRTSPRLNTSQE